MREGVFAVGGFLPLCEGKNPTDWGEKSLGIWKGQTINLSPRHGSGAI